ncbi:hypothetical protein [Streptomyces sp. NPDC021096]|uniref:hypothetical protein n=1 Tax=Streptomyces sp. NPDC021096 TaxID=3154792 RepID=UPI0033DA1621
MSAIRFSAAVAAGLAAVLFGAGGVHAVPGDGPSAVAPCSLVEKEGIDSHNCVQSAPSDGGKGKAFTGYEVVVKSNLLVAAHDNAQAIVDCPAGKKVLGGGFFGFIPEVRTFRSFPQGAAFTAWVVVVQNDSNVTSAFDAYAICAKVDC